MKVRIRNKNQIPYGGKWVYVDPDTGHSLWQVTWDNLIRVATEHRRANGLPIGLGFEDMIEERCCLDLPAECEGNDDLNLTNHDITLWDVVRGSRVMLEFKIAGSPLVPREEAIRRAEICKKCPLNSSFKMPCSGICQELRDVVSSVTNQYGIPQDQYLKSCRICHCYLEAAVKLPLDIQCKGVTDEMKRQFAIAKERFNCWKICDETL